MPKPILATDPTRQLRNIRTWVAIFIVGLVLSGITAFPLQHELHLTVRIATHFHLAQHAPALNAWLVRVSNALTDTDAHYPFLAYGTDWLAFGHLIIAIAFLGLYLDPVRNKWLVIFGLIAGPIRSIPLYWRLIDCSFGIFGCVPLLIVRHQIGQLECAAK